MAPRRAPTRARSHAGQANGEKLANLILEAAERGDWRAAAFLYARVYGSPKETVVTEEPESAAQRALKQMSTDELEACMRGVSRMAEVQAATPEERRDLLRRWNEEDEARAKRPPRPRRNDFEKDTEYFRAYRA